MRKLSIIIPVFNEEKTIGQVLEKLTNLTIPDWEKEIIVVDDGSTDNSKLKAQNAKLIIHEKNQGKGAAIKTGLQNATGDYVIIQDADLEYDPSDIPRLLQEVQDSKATVVYGSRNLKPRRRGYPHYVWGVAVLTFLTNLLYRSKLTDIYTGYKLFPTTLLREIPWASHGFEFEAEITVKILKKGLKIVEVPINYYPRTFSEGKKINFLDGLTGLWTIIKNWV